MFILFWMRHSMYSLPASQNTSTPTPTAFVCVGVVVTDYTVATIHLISLLIAEMGAVTSGWHQKQSMCPFVSKKCCATQWNCCLKQGKYHLASRCKKTLYGSVVNMSLCRAIRSFRSINQGPLGVLKVQVKSDRWQGLCCGCSQTAG